MCKTYPRVEQRCVYTHKGDATLQRHANFSPNNHFTEYREYVA